MDLKYCLSFDIGGTFIKYAIIDNEGVIHEKDKINTPGYPARETIPAALIDIFEKLKLKFNIICVGVSTAGQVDVDKCEVIYATDNIPGYIGTNFRDILAKKFNLDVFADNDVNSAAIGEMWLGSAKDAKNFLCMTLGTGVGGAIIIDNKLHRGNNYSAGEIGHFIIFPNGDKCTCGLNGCYERYASTSALIKMYKEELIKNNMICKDNYTGEYIVDLCYRGDIIASSVYNRFLDYIAYGIANLVHILDIGLVIVGGGISEQGDLFFNEINNRFKKYVLNVYKNGTIIKQAGLKNDAGVIGAAFNTFSHINIM